MTTSTSASGNGSDLTSLSSYQSRCCIIRYNGGAAGVSIVLPLGGTLMPFINQRRSIVFAAGIITFAVFVKVAPATHSWSGYHWARQTPQFTLKLGNNMSADWQPFLAKASSDWNSPTTWGWTGADPLLTAIVAG